MCWSFRASLTAFLIGGGASLYLIKRDKYYLDKQIGYVMFFIILMQLFEAMIWADQKCTGLNQMATKLAIPFIILQPIVAYYVFNDFFMGKARTHIDLLFTVYVIGTIIYLFHIFNGRSIFCTKADKNGLVWKWFNIRRGCWYHAKEKMDVFKKFNILVLFYYLLYLFLLIYPLFNLKKSNSMFALLLLATFIISNYIYWGTRSIGSWWCLAVVPIPVIKILFTQLK